MKTMTCKQLGGACDERFQADNFEQIQTLSQAHGKLMFQQQDPAHIQAMTAMSDLMQNPSALQAFMEEKRALFESLSND
ncbi:DUF1059 domain-containing protein [Shewanella japonica]|uniref:DUF1059 domain-containing protein n=1 Tax=Shewanella japonica TaxID=93973 RepID=A0ABM6JPJ8_9GAMM|nr:DUF1059 domain-containing protein [Shewanella japonica]ARD23509.1 hypothetical protein SJ2017_3245 [Shewanella japonica]